MRKKSLSHEGKALFMYFDSLLFNRQGRDNGLAVTAEQRGESARIARGVIKVIYACFAIHPYLTCGCYAL